MYIIPKHVAIIMDGNGRWAEARGLSRIAGHKAGLEVVRDVVAFASNAGVEVLSLFAFSTENWFRPRFEVDALMSLFSRAVDEEVAALHSKRIKIKFIGQLNELSDSLKKKILLAQEKTENNEGMILQLAVSYGGRWDITEACRKIASACVEKKITLESISENTVAEHLSSPELIDPDLIIRTSGEARLSNFFLWQSAYSELFFSEKYWPDFTLEDFEFALREFGERHRRYGKIEAC